MCAFSSCSQRAQQVFSDWMIKMQDRTRVEEEDEDEEEGGVA